MLSFRLIIQDLLSDEALALAVGPLGILVLARRDRHHLAVITLTTQPTEKGAFEQLGVEPVGLGASVLARYGYARWWWRASTILMGFASSRVTSLQANPRDTDTKTTAILMGFASSRVTSQTSLEHPPDEHRYGRTA